MRDINSQAGQPAGTPLLPQKNPPLHVLVVDDDGDMRRLNVEVLTKAGFKVAAAEDGAVAWDTLQQNRYDLVVTDNKMPKVTGVELLKKMHAAGMSQPVLMATETWPRDEFLRNPGIKPVGMLLQPYTTDEFLGKVEEVLRAIEVAREEIAPPDSQNLSTAGDWEP